jgi:hypothetical protein
MEKKLTAEQLLRKLLRFWMICIGFLALIILIQTFGNHYAPYIIEPWCWLWTNTIPVVSILIGPFVMKEKLKLSKRKLKWDDYRLIILSSRIYILLLLVSIPLEAYSLITATQFLNYSYLIFGPYQVFICGLEGILLVKT